MKCPKCSYLGFETGDRCRNCGYDFSLAAPATPAIDLPLRDAARPGPGGPQWADDLHPEAVPAPAAVSAVTPDTLGSMRLDAATVPGAVAGTQAVRAPRAASSLPLFQRPADEDEPLIKLPAAPRAPLAVRRTPDKPRLRAVSKRTVDAAAAREIATVPALEFADAPDMPPPLV